MIKLSKCRKKIDKIDSKIIRLFEERMQVVNDVATFKIDNKMPVLDSSREAIMLEKNLKKIKNDDNKKYYPHVLEGFLKASKEMQKDLIEHKK